MYEWICSANKPGEEVTWQERYVLYLWMSILVLVPFKIEVLSMSTVPPRNDDSPTENVPHSLSSHRDSHTHSLTHSLYYLFCRLSVCLICVQEVDMSHTLLTVAKRSLEESSRVREVSPHALNVENVSHVVTGSR